VFVQLVLFFLGRFVLTARLKLVLLVILEVVFNANLNITQTLVNVFLVQITASTVLLVAVA